MTELPSTVSTAIWNYGELVLSKISRPGASSTLLLLACAVDHPSPASIARLEYAYRLRNELDPAWAARPLELVRHHGKPALLIEDHGGEVLARLLGKPWDLDLFLRVATGLTVALRCFHERGLVHKDINPANIFVNVSNKQAWLSGFGLASRLARERQTLEPARLIAGTLAYMAPEQTGRMNRSVDSRSDLYSLGVTLYEMLTGELPFTASEPMEWIHCHVARQPPPPDERVNHIPAALSAIVLKLLAKNPEERYQTAAGLEADLRECLSQSELQGHIGSFQLGAQDVPDRLVIPERLYGRGAEIRRLLDAFESVAKGGPPELVLVSGYSGIGKSAVVNELGKSLPPKALFAPGKFDQYKRDIPYATMGQAFGQLLRSVLSLSEAELDPWREDLRQALGPNGLLMLKLIPELEPVIGPQPLIPDLPPRDAQNRFQMVFRRFVSVFATAEHPLVLFLDDLHWAETATLDLLGMLVTDPELHHLLVIGAYRDKEVDSKHPLMRRLETVRGSGTRVEDLVIAPLGFDELSKFLSETLRCERNRVEPLAQLLQEKTGGNPLFAIQFLAELNEAGLIVFNRDVPGWTWDVERIRTRKYTDNVADILVAKLNRLSSDVQDALGQLACFGESAAIETLEVIYGKSEEEIEAMFSEAVRTGLVLRMDRAYTFLHDRVREAAYSLMPEAERAATHLRIGRVLLAHTAPEKQEESVFEIVNQLNRGSELICSVEEREQVAELNLTAGKRAKASSAYASALNYFVVGRQLLRKDAWERRYELAFAIEINRAECEFITGDLVAARERLETLSARAVDVLHKAATTRLLIDMLNFDRPDRAVEVALAYLRETGMSCPMHPTDEEVREEYDQIWRRLGGRPIESLFDLPLMSDPASRATMDVLAEFWSAAYFFDLNLWCLFSLRMLNLSIEHGNCDASCVAYSMFLQTVMGRPFSNPRVDCRFGQLAFDLVEKRGLDRYKHRVYIAVGNTMFIWTRHLSGLKLIRRGEQIAHEIGDLTWIICSYHALFPNLLVNGEPLQQVQHEAEDAISLSQKAGAGTTIDLISCQLQLAKTLRGLTPSFGSFSDEGFDEDRYRERLEGDPRLRVLACCYWIRKLQAQFFAGDYGQGVVAAVKAQQLLRQGGFLFEEVDYHFYGALVRAAACNSATPDQRREHFEALAKHSQWLAHSAENCPGNVENRAMLAAAEIARLESREMDAEVLYQQAIRSARENGFVHNEGVAYEVAARFYAARGLDEFARLYLRNARSCYSRWGASGKVKQLGLLYPNLGNEELPAGSRATIGAPIEQLELATVLKVAKAVSGEIVLEKLIETVLRTAIEHSGAERGLLIVLRDSGLRIHAEATTKGSSFLIHLVDAPVSSAELPDSVLQYAARTRESVILEDAWARGAFSNDPYIRRQHARSILCLPLIKQGKLIAILYLENNLAADVFTPSRIAVLNVLASEAAISLENSRLYREVQEREAKVRRLVDANIVGVFIWGSEGQILEANDAFLELIGYSREDLASGRPQLTAITPPEWREISQQAVAQVAATGVCQAFEKEYFRKDGSRVPVLVGAAGLDGNSVVSFVVDLTERKRVEVALRRTAAYLAETQKLTHTGTFVNDGTPKPLYWSEELFRIFGFDPQQGLPTRDQLVERIHPQDRDKFWQAFRRGIREKADSDVEYRIVAPDGRLKHLYSLGHPVLDANGEFIEQVGSTVDITERKRADEQRERLQHLEEDLRHLNRVSMMGELAASIAHELGQPLSGIVSNGGACMRWLAADVPNLDEARQAIQRIVRDGKRAGEIVGRIRGLATRKPVARMEPLDLNETIGEVLALIEDRAKKNGVTIRTEFVDDIFTIVGDRVQLQQVLLNLAMNAIDAMGSLGDRARELVIVTRNIDSEQVQVTVEDSGTGIDPDKMDKIFESFYTTKPSGMGMGLSISRSILLAHGGRIWATVRDGPGTRFHFTLPARPAGAARA